MLKRRLRDVGVRGKDDASYNLLRKYTVQYTVYCIVYTVYVCTVHTLKPEINLNLCIKTRRVTVGADATVYVWFLCQIYC